MIRSLRRKFILIAMASLVGTMVILCTAIGIGNHYITTNRLDHAIALLRQNGGAFHPPGARFDPSAFDFQITPETPFETRYFMVKLTAEKEIKSVSMDHIAALDRRAVVDTIQRIIDTKAARGYVDHYRFGMFPDKNGGSTIIVLDCFLQLQSANNMRQRQFITDASHELKTPLAILSSNIGLLEDAYGRDKWLESARSQITRLDKLIKNLVELARTEETVREDAVIRFSISEVAQANVDAFRPLAEADGKSLAAEITDGIFLKGVQDNFFRLFSILLDNAVKYCDPEGVIRLSVSQRGRNIYIAVSNPCAGVNAAQLPRYFDRFYRADSSRARSTGGYGIGLSTARAIVTRHKGRISNHYADGVIAFTAVIPQIS